MVAATHSYIWQAPWRESTNGLRVQLSTLKDRGKVMVLVGVGSAVFTSLGGYVGAPGGKFTKFELRDSDHVVVPLLHPADITGDLSSRIALKKFPRYPDGGLKNHIGFFTNGPPFPLNRVQLDDVYQIQNPGDYTLTVGTAIYQFETNINYLDRVDLPEVTIKVHLYPH